MNAYKSIYRELDPVGYTLFKDLDWKEIYKETTFDSYVEYEIYMNEYADQVVQGLSYEEIY